MRRTVCKCYVVCATAIQSLAMCSSNLLAQYPNNWPTSDLLKIHRPNIFKNFLIIILSLFFVEILNLSAQLCI